MEETAAEKVEGDEDMARHRKKLTPKKKHGARNANVSPKNVSTREHRQEVEGIRSLLTEDDGESVVVPKETSGGKLFSWQDALPSNYVSR